MHTKLNYLNFYNISIYEGKETLKEKSYNNEKTKAIEADTGRPASKPSTKRVTKVNTSHVILKALLRELFSNQDEVPREMLTGVIKRFERMPRFGGK
ncbi:hypothetical protein NAPIS_ORF01410 [Vairimorpha apis BRL 01]|uniref:Uncharacterized protein n=1 Tax=Vairimorpha apis BRL 01 TaxID=1037528 RepID=T0L9B1_9MICR|nr:hypothetical protein NAPIS_ORF01410 [Vairimorpha apis BRL 01]